MSDTAPNITEDMAKQMIYLAEAQAASYLVVKDRSECLVNSYPGSVERHRTLLERHITFLRDHNIIKWSRLDKRRLKIMAPYVFEELSKSPLELLAEQAE